MGRRSDADQTSYTSAATATGNRDYVKTYHPPSETEHERAVGDETTRT
jgi:hypothetical protein